MLGVKVIYTYMKIMWDYSEAFTSHRHKTIVLYFFNNYTRSCSLVKFYVWINHVDTWRRFDDDTTSMRLHINFVSMLKQLCLSKGMQRNAVKSIFLEFWAMVQSCSTVMQKKFWKTSISYSASCITPSKDCMLLILLIKKILIVWHSSSWVLQCIAL